MGRRRTQVAGVPRVALRSTLGYLIMPRWGERSGYGSVLIEHCRRSKMWWGYSVWRLPDGPMPQRGGRIAGSLNEARWLNAPTGRKGIAQGKAKRRPGIGVPETTQALKGRNRRRVNPCVMFRPFRAFANWGVGVPSAMAYDPGWRTTQGDASLYPGLSHYAPLGRTIPWKKLGDCPRGFSPLCSTL